MIFLGQRIMKPPRKRREREKCTDIQRPRPIPGLPGEHPAAGASQPATSPPEGAFHREPSESSGFRYAPSNSRTPLSLSLCNTLAAKLNNEWIGRAHASTIELNELLRRSYYLPRPRLRLDRRSRMRSKSHRLLQTYLLLFAAILELLEVYHIRYTRCIRLITVERRTSFPPVGEETGWLRWKIRKGGIGGESRKGRMDGRGMVWRGERGRWAMKVGGSSRRETGARWKNCLDVKT